MEYIIAGDNAIKPIEFFGSKLHPNDLGFLSQMDYVYGRGEFEVVIEFTEEQARGIIEALTEWLDA